MAKVHISTDLKAALTEGRDVHENVRQHPRLRYGGTPSRRSEDQGRRCGIFRVYGERATNGVAQSKREKLEEQGF
jgi:hypothetical protein